MAFKRITKFFTNEERARYKKKVRSGITTLLGKMDDIKKKYEASLDPKARKRFRKIWESMSKALDKVDEASKDWLEVKPRKKK